MNSSDGLELNIVQIRLHSGYKTCMSYPKSIPAVYIGHTPMWIRHMPRMTHGGCRVIATHGPHGAAHAARPAYNALDARRVRWEYSAETIKEHVRSKYTPSSTTAAAVAAPFFFH